MSKIVIIQRRSGNYYFHLQAPNGQVIVISQDYASKVAVMNGIESMKRWAHTETIEDLTNEN
jgi:uncharacterized protein YegP (UPF0339 family)